MEMFTCEYKKYEKLYIRNIRNIDQVKMGFWERANVCDLISWVLFFSTLEFAHIS